MWAAVSLNQRASPIERVLYFLLQCKAMKKATISGKKKIVIPKEARAALGVKAGDKLLVIVRNEQVIVLQKPKSYQAAIRGLAQGVYPKGYFEKNGKAGTRSAAGLPPAARRIAL